MNSAPLTLLLVEDDPGLAATQQQALTERGYQVRWADSGTAALAALNGPQSAPHLILMDINLDGGLNGVETARAILAEHDIPLVFLSSHTDPDLIALTERISSYGYVVKGSGILALDLSIKMALRLFESRQKLQAALLQYQGLIENSPDLTVVTDAQGLTTFVSPQCESVLGHPREKFLGIAFPDIIHADDLDRVRETWARVYKNGQNLRDYEYRILDRQGQLRWISHSARIIRRGSEILSVEMSIRNITEQKAVSEALLQKEAALEGAHSAIALADLDGRLTYVNPAFLRLWGYAQADEVLGRSATGFWQDPGKAQQVYEALNSQGHWEGALILRRLDGNELSVSVRAALIQDRDRRPRGLMASFEETCCGGLSPGSSA